MTRREFFRECVFKLKKIWYGYCETHKKLCTNKKSFWDSGCPECKTLEQHYAEAEDFNKFCEAVKHTGGT